MALTQVSRGLLSTSIVDNGNATAITIDSSENVGIGTTAPERLLHVNSAGVQIGALIQSTSTLSSRLSLMDANTTSSAKVGIGATGDTLGLYAGGSARATVDASGSVGIGTSSPSGKLHIVTAANGSTTIGSASDELVLENNGDCGLTIRSSATSTGVISFADDDDHNIGQVYYDHATDVMILATNDAERMRIDSNGNLLVGTTSTAVSSSTGSVTGSVINSTGLFEAAKTGTVMELNRLTADGTILNFRKDGSNVGSIGVKNNDVTVGTGDTGLRFTNSTNQIWAVDTTDGSSRDAAVDLGNSTVRFKDLYLSGNATHGTTPSSSAAGAFTEAVGRTTYSRGSGTGGFSHLIFINGNGTVGTVTTSGSATAYNTSSDYRLKENIVAMSGATERLKQLNPSRFNFIADADTTVDGFLAHEVADVVPEAISGTKDAVDADGNPEYQGIDQSKLVPLLVATIQELEARITQLENN